MRLPASSHPSVPAGLVPVVFTEASIHVGVVFPGVPWRGAALLPAVSPFVWMEGYAGSLRYVRTYRRQERVERERVIPGQKTRMELSHAEPGEPPSPSPKPEAIWIAYCFHFSHPKGVALPISSCFNQSSLS